MNAINSASLVANVIQDELPDAGVYLVGGCVRDRILSPHGFDGPETKDVDIEVFNAPYDKLLTALQKRFEVDLVGSAFAVIKIKGMPVDVSLPRLEIVTGAAHTDFAITVDPNLTVAQAALRRDFTINAIYYHFPTGELVDPYEGEIHLKARLLHPVSEKFDEDALRALRAMQFIARFNLIPSFETVLRCKNLIPKLRLVAKERVQEEWNKLLLKGVQIGKGLQFLEDSSILGEYPELKALVGVKQHPEHHPEGDAWIHTKHCLDALPGVRTGNEEDDVAVAFAVLGHDLGKATTTTQDETGKITAHGHESASVPLVRQFMERMYQPAQPIIDLVGKLVENHMRPVAIYNSSATISALRRCSVAVDGRLDLLMRVVQCDQSGRPPKEPDLTAAAWVMKIVEEAAMSVSSKPTPIVKGRHLIESFQLAPGPNFKPILDDAFQAQLDGKFVDLPGGLEHVRTKIVAS